MLMDEWDNVFKSRRSNVLRASRGAVVIDRGSSWRSRDDGFWIFFSHSIMFQNISVSEFFFVEFYPLLRWIIFHNPFGVSPVNRANRVHRARRSNFGNDCRTALVRPPTKSYVIRCLKLMLQLKYEKKKTFPIHARTNGSWEIGPVARTRLIKNENDLISTIGR